MAKDPESNWGFNKRSWTSCGERRGGGVTLLKEIKISTIDSRKSKKML